MNAPTPSRSRRRGWTAFRAEALDSLLMALQSLAAHKLRAVLTLLGVVVGVFSIIMVMTAIRAMQSNIETELSGLGAYTFTIERWPGITFEGPAGWEKFRRRKMITLQNALDLREQASLAISVAAETGFGSGEVASRFEKTEPDVALTGVTPEAFGARNWIVETGRAIMPGDADASRNVCVLASALAKKLFPQGGSPLNERVKFNGITYTVVGVLEAKGGFGGQAQDNFMIIPITTGLNRYGSIFRSVSIYVQTRGEAWFDDTAEQVRGILRKVRKVPPGAEDDFEIFSNDSLIEQFRGLTFAVRIGAAAVSSIALLAAGIGIMNIMLVSVTERTREIGVRRAIGAKKRNVLTQFILEAVVLCELGGVIGVVLGVAAGNLAAHFLKVPPVLPLDWVVIGLVICSLIGIVFGTYPAVKAANLNPIDSLRYE